MFLHNTKQHEAMPTEFVAIKAIEKQKQEMHCNQNEIDLKTNRYRNKKGFKIKKLNEISSKIYNNLPPCCLLRLNCSRDANFPAFFPFLVKTRRHRSADWRELGKYISFLPFTVAVARWWWGVGGCQWQAPKAWAARGVRGPSESSKFHQVFTVEAINK